MPSPRVVVEPADFARALNADPVARTAYDRLAYGRKLQLVGAIEDARSPRRAHDGSSKPWQCSGPVTGPRRSAEQTRTR